MLASQYKTHSIAQYGVTGFVEELNVIGGIVGTQRNKCVHAYQDFTKFCPQESQLKGWKTRPAAFLKTPPTIHQRARLRNPDEFPPENMGFLLLADEPPRISEIPLQENATVIAQFDLIRLLDKTVRPVYYFDDWVCVKIV